MSLDPITSGALAFSAVLILMALNIPIGISMLIVGFTGFGFIVGLINGFLSAVIGIPSFIAEYQNKKNKK